MVDQPSPQEGPETPGLPDGSTPGASAFEGYWQLRTQGAASRLSALKAIVRHNPTTGTFAEALLRELIAEFLPQRYAAATGFILDGAEQSNQIDILVYDQREDLPVFRDGSFVVLTPGTARLVIEVKSRLVFDAGATDGVKTFGDLGRAFDNIASAKRIDPGVRGFVFAFDGNAAETFTRHAADWGEARSAPRTRWPDRVFNMNKGFVMMPDPATTADNGGLVNGSRHEVRQHEDPHLVVRSFLTTTLQTLDVPNVRSVLPADPAGEVVGEI